MTHKNILRRLELFISSDQGQRLFNIAYSLGAAVVIWGALYKILHLRGGDLLLAIGMGTEVVMFILTAFDRPALYQEAQENKTETKSTVAYSQNVNHEPISYSPHKYASAIEDVIVELNKLKETTTALNVLYELQLKSASAQLNAMESGSQQSRNYSIEAEKMNENMAELNRIYQRMITAMSSGDIK